MTPKLLLTMTAIIEIGAGLALLAVPDFAAKLLLSAELHSPAAIVVGRIAGAALFSIGVTCALESGGSGRRSGLLIGLMSYNVSVVALLGYAASASNICGIALWPACGMHLVLAIWCVVCLRAK